MGNSGMISSTIDFFLKGVDNFFPFVVVVVIDVEEQEEEDDDDDDEVAGNVSRRGDGVFSAIPQTTPPPPLP